MKSYEQLLNENIDLFNDNIECSETIERLKTDIIRLQAEIYELSHDENIIYRFISKMGRKATWKNI